MNYFIIPFFFLTISFGDLPIESPEDFVEGQFIEQITEALVPYLTGLAGITAFKYLLRM